MKPQGQPTDSRKCKHTLISVVLAILAIGGLGFGGYKLWQNAKKDVAKYYFEDNSIPGGNYYVEINYDTKSLFVKEENYCSAVDCDSSVEENTVVLSNDELATIKQVLATDFDESSLGGALSSLAKNDEIMESKDDHEEKYWLAIYAQDDLNMDGIITYREFGNAWLNTILEDSIQ